MRIEVKLFTEQRTFSYPESNFRVTLRPFPFSEASIGPEATVAGNLERQFMYCVASWEGLADTEGTALECTPENKKLVYDFVPALREWILERLMEVAEAVRSSLGN